MWKKCVDYTENTLDYVEILVVNKIGNKAFPMYRTTQFKLFNRINLLNIMPADFDVCLLCFQYLLIGISSFNTGFP